METGMKIVVAVATACALVAGTADAQVYVKPHINRDGTFVEGHHRSAPNSTKLDNYSTQGNVNPYTGQSGTVNPYAQPSYSAPTYSPPSYSPSMGQQCGYTQSGRYVCR